MTTSDDAAYREKIARNTVESLHAKDSGESALIAQWTDRHRDACLDLAFQR